MEDVVEVHEDILAEVTDVFPVEDSQDKAIKKDIRPIIDELITTTVASNCNFIPHRQHAQLKAASCKYYRFIIL